MAEVEVTWTVKHTYTKKFDESELPELRKALGLKDEATGKDIFEELMYGDSERALEGWSDDRTWQDAEDWEVVGGVGRG